MKVNVSRSGYVSQVPLPDRDTGQLFTRASISCENMRFCRGVLSGRTKAQELVLHAGLSLLGSLALMNAMLASFVSIAIPVIIVPGTLPCAIAAPENPTLARTSARSGRLVLRMLDEVPRRFAVNILNSLDW